MKYIAPLLLAYALFTFTAPGGEKVAVNADQITSVSNSLDCDGRAHAKISTGATFLCVQETVDQVLDRLKATN